jgi:hypothetical protein
MLAPSITRKRVFYVNPAASIAEPTGSVDAPFNNIDAALAHCLPDSAYDSEDAYALLPTLMLLAGIYPPCTFDRPALVQGSGAFTALPEVTCATELLTISDCSIGSLAGTGVLTLHRCTCAGACSGTLTAVSCDLSDLEWDGDVTAESCSALPTPISGTLTAVNSSFDACAVSGDVTLTRCNGGSLVAESDLTMSACQLTELQYAGGIVSDSFLYFATAREGAGTLSVIGSTLMFGRTSGMVWVCSRPRAVEVPDIVELTETRAIEVLELAGITQYTRSEVYDPAIEAGVVVEQGTIAGTFTNETESITYSVSLGPEPVQVPDLAGLELAAAELVLTAATLVSGTSTTEYSETVAIDLIISQSPLAGEMALPGSAVDVVVSLGPEEE